jgi:PhzF family phenazine biosynthesis protein
MKTGEYYLVNAFTGENALGNQTCVLMMDDISDTVKLQSLAKDFNLPATTFLKKTKAGYDVRWFSADMEIGLCGHGTVAATWVLTQVVKESKKVEFKYNDGTLSGELAGEMVQVEGRAFENEQIVIPDHVQAGFSRKVRGYFKTDNKDIVLLDSEKTVRTMKPNWKVLTRAETFGYVITSESDNYDFVSRTILPFVSYQEDQATGSSHMMLAPFYAERLEKNTFHAFQASGRGGDIHCELDGDKVRLKANCHVFAHGQLF